jgi:SAM-dependent methyltransferase
MQAEEYRRLREQEERYWWHVGRRAVLAELLRKGVRPDVTRRGVDVGCGTGSNFALLSPYGRFYGTEVSLAACTSAQERPPRPVVLARGEALPFASASLGIVTMFDVLEHVAAEDAFLGEVLRVLRPEGLLVVSVPAYMALWSEHDVSLHHHRRYVRSTLSASLERNGFRPLRVSHAMASILLPVAVVRGMGRMFPRRRPPRSSYVPTPAPLNALLVGLLRLEAAWLAHADLPFGTTVLALAQKVAS